MRLLEERIKEDGQVRPGNILKVDSFLNHQLDVSLLEQLGKEFFERFKDKGITRILTIEASGIALACLAAQYFKVPVVFAKKAKSKNLDGELYTSTVHSFTYGKDFTVTLSKKFLTKDDTVLLIDDFLANGCALQGLISIVNESGGTVEGIGIAIEKGFQSGGRTIRNLGFHLESLAIIDSMDAATQNVEFRQQED